MLNRIWFLLLLVGILYGFGKGAVGSWRASAGDVAAMSEHAGDAAKLPAQSPLTLVAAGKQLNEAAIDSAELSVKICIQLIGIMALWLGLLKVAEDAGLVASLAWSLRPIMRWLFPGVPDGHPAQGAMLMNISANMLGLDNAATPMGLKAMKELQTLNPTDDTATDAMATFLALNTSSVTIIPFTIIGYRAAADSNNPTGPLAAMILTTTVSTIVAVIVVRWLARLPRFAFSSNGTSNESTAPQDESA
jgi:spore maturation protein A